MPPPLACNAKKKCIIAKVYPPDYSTAHSLLLTNLRSPVRDRRARLLAPQACHFTTGMLNRFRPDLQLLGLHCPGLNPGRSFP